jgi:hypothetical protein
LCDWEFRRVLFRSETKENFFFLSNATTCSPELRGLPSGGGEV